MYMHVHYLHAGVEYLEYVVLQCDRGHTVVGENSHHSLIQDREQGGHGLHVRMTFLFLLEPLQGNIGKSSMST